MSEPAPRRPSTALSIVAAILPVVFLSLSCLLWLAIVVLGGGVERLGYALEELGVGFYLISGVTALSLLVVTVFLWLAARGFRVPSAVTIAFAAGPWLTGLFAVTLSMMRLDDVVESIDVSSMASFLAQALSESMGSTLLGATLSSGLFASVAFGLALGAFGQPADNRKPLIGAAVGALILPLVGLACFGVLVDANGLSLLLIAAALGAAIAVPLGAAAAGGDAPHGRSAALASAVPIASGLSVAAAAVAISTAGLMLVFGAVANADASSRAMMLAMGAQELEPILVVARYAAPASLLAAAGVAGWAFTRSKPDVIRLGGAVALVVVAGFVVAADRASVAYGSSVMENAMAPRWSQVEDFEPVELASLITYELSGAPDAALTPRGLVAFSGRTLAGWQGPTMQHELSRMTVGEELHLAIDRRLNAMQLRHLLNACRAIGIETLVFHGADSNHSDDVHFDTMRETFPVIAPLFRSLGSVAVVVSSSETEQAARLDDTLLHAVVGASSPFIAETRPGAQVAEDERLLTDPVDYDYRDNDERRHVYLGFADDASVQSVLQTAARAQKRGMITVLVPGEIPGAPEEPAFVPTPFDNSESAIGQGSLSRDAIRGVIRRHINEVRFCYEQALTDRPDLEGRVLVSFVISPTGSVSSASVAETSLNNERVETCITNAVMRWTFPAPDGGVVGVNYPFVLTST